MTTQCAVDFHARSQTIKYVSDRDEEIRMVKLVHETDDVRRFYSELEPPVIVALEAHGYTAWFEELLEELGITVRMGDAAKIRASKTRKQKNDPRDTEHIFELLMAGRFPDIYAPSPQSRAIRQMIAYRHSLVRTRTRIANSLSAIALSRGMTRKPKVLTRNGRKRVLSIPMGRELAQQRSDWFELLDLVESKIKGIEAALEAEAEKDPRVVLLRTQPGVGLVSALTLVHVIGPPERFATSRMITAYVGLDPVEDSSGDKRRIGAISKQGSRFLRFLLVEIATTCTRLDPNLRAYHDRVSKKHHRNVAKVAVARRVLVRSWIMLRDNIDYDEFCRRGQKTVASNRVCLSVPIG
jgi:transposase